MFNTQTKLYTYMTYIYEYTYYNFSCSLDFLIHYKLFIHIVYTQINKEKINA